MTEDQPIDQGSLFPKSAGERLREAREAQGLTLTDIANRTRVPMRHLEAIEAMDFSGLPSPTYAIGFAKSYARVVGVDENAIAAEIRHDPNLPIPPAIDRDVDDLDNPRRLPSRGIAMIAGILAVLIVIGAGIWYGTELFRRGYDNPIPAPSETAAPIEAAPSDTPTPAAPETGGQVSLTATDSVWLRVYDASGKTLVQKTLQAGERYDVPQDANGPMINVGRPDKLQVTLNGSAMPALGDGKVAIKDVGVSAAAIRARASGAPAPAPSATPTPTTTPTRAARIPSAFAPSPSPSPDTTGAPDASPPPNQ